MTGTTCTGAPGAYIWNNDGDKAILKSANTVDTCKYAGGPVRDLLSPSPVAENLLRLVDIAQLLGVSKQRAHQLSRRRKFPTPAATYSRGRLWRQSDVQRWARDYRGGTARWRDR